MPAPPLSNAERQRNFQDAHPGYDRRRKARERARGKRVSAQFRAKMLAQAEAARKEQAAQAHQSAVAEATEAPVMTLATKPVLMLPAPVEDPVMAELKALAASLKSATAEPLSVKR